MWMYLNCPLTSLNEFPGVIAKNLTKFSVFSGMAKWAFLVT